MPLLIDSTQGARLLGVSLTNFYRFMRKQTNAPPVMVGSIHMWKRKDLLRLIGKPCDEPPVDDFLIDAKAIAELCSISRSMVYKLNDEGMMPDAAFKGKRAIRWDFQEIEEWVEAGCPPRRKTKRKARGGKA
jgi:predicted DNA-binding transcriptional regulator AlpA